MTLPTPWIEAVVRAYGIPHPERLTIMFHEALLAEGAIWWSDTGDRESNSLMLANRHWNSRCEPVLVVPLARHNPNQAAT